MWEFSVFPPTICMNWRRRRRAREFGRCCFKVSRMSAEGSMVSTTSKVDIFNWHEIGILGESWIYNWVLAWGYNTRYTYLRCNNDLPFWANFRDCLAFLVLTHSPCLKYLYRFATVFGRHNFIWTLTSKQSRRSVKDDHLNPPPRRKGAFLQMYLRYCNCSKDRWPSVFVHFRVSVESLLVYVFTWPSPPNCI